MPITLNEENFYETIQSATVVLVQFTSDFCGSCQAMAHSLEQVREAFDESIIIAEVKTIDNPDWAEAFAVQSTPTVLLFYKGKNTNRLTGVHTKSAVSKWIREVVA
ncbi:thioredoxin family protein [Alkalibacterium pelagium]|jgi:thioredoxin-like negative regulator of GroEL|uniref:Thioredoxin n=1 Tax=Alkalibacterium pelagium TaxID=426702 RepID=A0A1H7K998_9LACT|nr:thioredoxin family protein [Alkalibacterium pelagium]SEK83070.1 thioredoxin [Alkalibacterium pelagium]